MLYLINLQFYVICLIVTIYSYVQFRCVRPQSQETAGAIMFFFSVLGTGLGAAVSLGFIVII